MNVSLCPIGSLRSAGIPFSWLDEIACTDAAARVDRAGDEAALRIASGAVEESGRALREIAGRPLFQLAVACASPDVYETTLVGYVAHPERHGRKRKRALGALLQRFAAKNDTANGFGPIDRVVLGGDVALLAPNADADERAERRGLLSWWVVQAVADTAARELEEQAQLPWKLRSYARVEGDILRVGERSMRVDREQALALVHVRDADVVDEAPLTEFRRLGLVTRPLHVPTSLTDPAVWLVARLRELPVRRASEVATQLEEARGLAQSISVAPASSRAALFTRLERHLSAIVGRELGSRGQGEFYADRRVMYEEARGAAADYRLGDGLLARLEAALKPVAELGATYGYMRHRVARDWLRRRLGNANASLPDLAQLLSEEEDALVAAEQSGCQSLVESLERAFKAAAGTPDAATVEELLSNFPRPELSLSSPDVMLDVPARIEDAEIVIGEDHAGVQVLGFLQMFFDETQVLSWLESALPKPFEAFAQFVAPRAQGKAFLPEIPAWSIEFEAAALSPLRAPIGDVRLQWVGERPLLRMPTGALAELLPLDLLNPLYRALSPHGAELPVLELAPFTPELRLGEAVIQRARWRLKPPAASPTTDTERFVFARRWRREWGFPEQVFVKADNQRKPFYVDFRSPVLTDVLWHWLRGAREVIVSPMQPRSDGLWLRRGTQRFCSELRLSTVAINGQRQDIGGL
jgi:hypothetical protein